MATAGSETKNDVPDQKRDTKTKRTEEKDTRRRTEKEFFQDELEKVKEQNEKYKSGLNPPEQEMFVPYTFNPLKPYTDTRQFESAIKEPLQPQHHPVCRNTALGACDPWVSLEMDHNFRPAAPSTAREPPSSRSKNRKEKKGSSKQESEKENDHMTDQYPTVNPLPSQFHGKILRFDQVPKLRDELSRTYSTEAKRRIEEEYERTKRFLQTRELDKMEDYGPASRPSMRKAYFAYLQNNPGSRKAVNECVREADKRKKKTEKTEENRDSDKDRNKGRDKGGDKGRETVKQGENNRSEKKEKEPEQNRKNSKAREAKNEKEE